MVSRKYIKIEAVPDSSRNTGKRQPAVRKAEAKAQIDSTNLIDSLNDIQLIADGLVRFDEVHQRIIPSVIKKDYARHKDYSFKITGLKDENPINIPIDQENIAWMTASAAAAVIEGKNALKKYGIKIDDIKTEYPKIKDIKDIKYLDIVVQKMLAKLDDGLHKIVEPPVAIQPSPAPLQQIAQSKKR